jgi:hypothetical protein
MHLIIPPTLLPQHQSKIRVGAVLCAAKWVNVMKQGATVKTVGWLCVLHSVLNVIIELQASRGMKGTQGSTSD